MNRPTVSPFETVIAVWWRGLEDEVAGRVELPSAFKAPFQRLEACLDRRRLGGSRD